MSKSRVGRAWPAALAAGIHARGAKYAIWYFAPRFRSRLHYPEGREVDGSGRNDECPF